MCRFLNFGDTDGDGVREIIASTRQKGIFVAEREGVNWQAVCVVPGSISGASNTPRWSSIGTATSGTTCSSPPTLRRRCGASGTTEAEAYTSEDILDLEGEKYFIWNVMPLPAGR